MATDNVPNTKFSSSKLFPSMTSRSDLPISTAFVHLIPTTYQDILDNIMLLTDSYKLAHHRTYKGLGIDKIYSYLEARDGKTKFSHTVWFGIHHILKQINQSIHHIGEFIDFTEAIVDGHFSEKGNFNKEMWLAVHDLGYMPLRIRSAREGSVVNVGNVLLTIENTDGPHVGKSGTIYDKSLFAPLVNHLESHLLQVWYPSTVATMSRCVKDIMIENIKKSYNSETGDFLIKEVVPYLLHDFGLRGSAHMMSAALGGLGHLINFIGSDTVPSILLGIRDYGVTKMPAFSVHATEHSINTSRGMDPGVKSFIPPHLLQEKGTPINETDIDEFIRGMDSFLDKYSKYTMVKEDDILILIEEKIDGIKHINDDTNEFSLIRDEMVGVPTGILSMVLDSYNIFVTVAYICRNLGSCLLFRLVEGLKQGLPVSKFVIRPDSQEPEEVIPIIIKIIEFYFGKTNDNINTMIHRKGGENEGFFSLPDFIGILWGDGMNPSSVKKLYDNASTGWKSQGYTSIDNYSATNFVVGMGGGLLQKCTRDDQRFAFKCSAKKDKSSDEWIEIQKSPIGRTVDGIVDKSDHKVSKKGLLKLLFDPETKDYKTVPITEEGEDMLLNIYEDGIMYKDSDVPTLDGIRWFTNTQHSVTLL